MNEELRKKADASYLSEEKKARDYFRLLKEKLEKKTYASTLPNDFKIWKKNHISKFPFTLFNESKKREHLGYHNYIKWMNFTGKLDDYLDRSISYIYMRDLGKALQSKETQDKIEQSVSSLKERLLHATSAAGQKEAELFSMAGLYRKAQEEGVELTLIWLINKLKTVSSELPEGIDPGEAKRKLIKIIAGVIMHQLDEMGDDISQDERTKRLDEAIRLGYSYGLTYPFIDDLLDSHVLTKEEQEKFSNLIRDTLITGSTTKLGEWTGPNKKLIEFVHSELGNAYEYIKAHQHPTRSDYFFAQSYVFFHSQEVDRMKDLSNTSYTNEEIFIPIILKSASSRLIVRNVISAPEDEGFDQRTFYYGIYNQLADDFTDMFEDMEARSVTPYTYYLKYHKVRPDLINPFELYWTVVSNLIHHVYQSDDRTREVILARAINSQKRFKERIGTEKYKEVMEILSFDKDFDNNLQKIIRNAKDVDFFDKLLRDYITTNNEKEQTERDDFSNTVKSVRDEINHALPVMENNPSPLLKEQIVEAANYSLESGGKRLRPIMTWFIGVKEYGLDPVAIVPLLKSLEYMHTASLIYDDLPAQDDAPIRRGRPTLHEVYNVATAELAGLFLTQKAVVEQTALKSFPSETVLRLIEYSSQTITDICKGQAMDLHAKGKSLSIEHLNTICFYKTGIAFEASLVMPAILAGKEEAEIAFLKKVAYHAGIAFQIKDDLLDVEGDISSLGKPAGIDVENKTANFVSVLGADEAKKAMWEHYCLAMEELEQRSYQTNFLKHFLNYIVYRDK